MIEVDEIRDHFDTLKETFHLLTSQNAQRSRPPPDTQSPDPPPHSQSFSPSPDGQISSSPPDTVRSVLDPSSYVSLAERCTQHQTQVTACAIHENPLNNILILERFLLNAFNPVCCDCFSLWT